MNTNTAPSIEEPVTSSHNPSNVAIFFQCCPCFRYADAKQFHFALQT